jgi:hypothetical protein
MVCYRTSRCNHATYNWRRDWFHVIRANSCLRIALKVERISEGRGTGILERDVHTLHRLPTGIWYSPGVKANVLFFDKKPLATTPATKEIWAYDLRSDRSFSLRQNPIVTTDLSDIIHCYHADDRNGRKETGQFRRFTYVEIVARDKANLEFQWQQETTTATQGEAPQALVKEILKDLEEAMRELLRRSPKFSDDAGSGPYPTINQQTRKSYDLSGQGKQ